MGVEAMSVAAALSSCERPAGDMLAACQAAQDIALGKRAAAKLAGRMRGDGKTVGEDNEREAAAAAVHALALWRAGLALRRCEVSGGDEVVTAEGDRETLAARVAWRACVAVLSDDTLGESLSLSTAVLPGESREERAARLAIERHQHTRQARLVRRLDVIATGRGRRAQAVEKVRNALALVLAGDSLDDAATAAGFKASGRTGAGSRLVRACQRLGILFDGFQLHRRARA